MKTDLVAIHCVHSTMPSSHAAKVNSPENIALCTQACEATASDHQNFLDSDKARGNTVYTTNILQ